MSNFDKIGAYRSIDSPRDNHAANQPKKNGLSEKLTQLKQWWGNKRSQKNQQAQSSPLLRKPGTIKPQASLEHSLYGATTGAQGGDTAANHTLRSSRNDSLAFSLDRKTVTHNNAKKNSYNTEKPDQDETKSVTDKPQNSLSKITPFKQWVSKHWPSKRAKKHQTKLPLSHQVTMSHMVTSNAALHAAKDTKGTQYGAAVTDHTLKSSPNDSSLVISWGMKSAPKSKDSAKSHSYDTEESDQDETSSFTDESIDPNNNHSNHSTLDISLATMLTMSIEDFKDTQKNIYLMNCPKISAFLKAQEDPSRFKQQYDQFIRVIKTASIFNEMVKTRQKVQGNVLSDKRAEALLYNHMMETVVIVAGIEKTKFNENDKASILKCFKRSLNFFSSNKYSDKIIENVISQISL